MSLVLEIRQYRRILISVAPLKTQCVQTGQYHTEHSMMAVQDDFQLLSEYRFEMPSQC